MEERGRREKKRYFRFFIKSEMVKKNNNTLVNILGGTFSFLEMAITVLQHT